MTARTIPEISDEILLLKGKVKKLESQIELHKKDQALLEQDLEKLATEQGLTAGKGAHSAFTIAPHIVPQVTDWEPFYRFIKRNSYFHLLERRPAVVACRELWEQGRAIPGVEKFTKVRINVKEI